MRPELGASLDLLALLILYPGAALSTSWLITRQLIQPSAPLRLLDKPNPRSLHAHPRPRTGGLAVVGAIMLIGVALVITGAWPPGSSIAWIVAGALLLLGVSLADDFGHVAPAARLVAHLAAALCVVAGGFVPTVLELPGLSVGMPIWLSFTLAALFVVWMVNLYNFMDGMDGFAGGMAVIGFTSYGLLAWFGGDAMFALASWSIAGAAGGFLLWNFPPARIFMGDVGSTLLGFLAAVLALRADATGLFPMWVGVLVFSPFIVDATVTLIRRALRGEKVWVAHRRHYYQRLVRSGWGHRKTVLWEYGLMVGAGGSALATTVVSPAAQLAVMAVWGTIYGALGYALARVAWEAD